MKRVLLVNTNTEKTPYPVAPLGICMLAAQISDEYEVRVYDGTFDEGAKLPGIIREFNPDYVGFSIRNVDDVVADRTIFYPEAILKCFVAPARLVTNVPFILGGSGFSIFPVELMEYFAADYGLTGDAVHSFPELIKSLSKGIVPDGIAGLYKRDVTVSGKQAGSTPVQFTDAGRFARIDSRIDFSRYSQKGAYSIQTKRGCVHRCIYCTYPVIEGRKFVPRDVADIVDEMEDTVQRLGNVTFEFVDSTFNDPPGHAEAICGEIIRRNKKYRMRTMGINPGHVTGELFPMMKEAGFAQIDATPDTASASMLRRLGKGFSLDDVRRMAGFIRDCDMPTMWFFLMGGPGEDEDTFNETLDFIDNYINHADLVYMAGGMRIYPGTPLQRIAASEGIIDMNTSLFYPPVYYFSRHIGRAGLTNLIQNAASRRVNLIPANETTPPAAMMAEAMELRQKNNLTEPVFRSLLRIRKLWKEEGREL